MARTTKKRELFTLDVPQAKTVALAGDFTDWEKSALKMKKAKTGPWKVEVSLPPGTYEYRFLVDGEWHNDPSSPTQKPNAFGSMNSVRDVKE